jgi:hypothetical protein
MLKLAIIIGSTRPGRVGEAVGMLDQVIAWGGALQPLRGKLP